MRPEAQRWFDKAQEDLAVARYLFQGAQFSASSFHAQQAAEKALKALQVERTRRFSRVHDLVVLARELGAPEALVPPCELLGPAYVAARYPDAAASVGSDDASELLDAAEEVVSWVRLQIS